MDNKLKTSRKTVLLLKDEMFCPSCGKIIQKKAKKCKYCKHALIKKIISYRRDIEMNTLC